MVKIVKYTVLFPFSLLYGFISQIRNFIFDKGFAKSTKFDIPTICVGNLAVGGTGKTPHVEYLLTLLQNECQTAMLSRGYKRKTKGFQLADENSNAAIIGDEPFQIQQKFPKVTVAVAEKRVHGVEKLLEQTPDLELVVLDDAFQHRSIQSGFSILLTDYSRLYTRDFYLPAGRLRESKRESKRANIIVVTKCPNDISNSEMLAIQTEIKPQKGQTLFFSTYKYDNLIPVFPDFERKATNETLLKKDFGILIVAGIVSPQPIVSYLHRYTTQIETLFFPDHHNFSKKDMELLCEKFDSINAKEKIIVVTEKDAARLLSMDYPDKLKSKTFALPVQIKILNNKEKLFTEKIKHYVRENSRNG